MWFHFITILNGSQTWMCKYLCGMLTESFRDALRNGVIDHMIVLFLDLKGTSILLSKVAVAV